MVVRAPTELEPSRPSINELIQKYLDGYSASFEKLFGPIVQRAGGEKEEVRLEATEEQLEAIKRWYEEVRLFVSLVTGTDDLHLPTAGITEAHLWPIYSVCYTASLKVTQMTRRGSN